MTVVAYNHKDGELAVDGRTSRGNQIACDKSIKYVKTELGTYVFCGFPGEYDDFISEFEGGARPSIAYESHCLLISKGAVHHISQLKDGEDAPIFYKMPIDFDYAIGSGMSYATAAMDFGKSAKEAVEYTINRDSSCGGKISVFDVKTGKMI